MWLLEEMRATDLKRADPPLPPPELMARVGQQRRADKEAEGELSVAEWYLLFGERLRDSVLEILPDDFDLAGKRVLDFGCGSGRVLRHFVGSECELWGCDLDTESIEWLQKNMAGSIRAFENEPMPPLPLEDRSFDLALALSVFTHLTENWSDWLLELHRLVRPGGYVVASFIGPAMANEMTGDSLTEDEIGMNAIGLAREFSRGSGPIVFHSAWWLEAHWGRAFDILELKQSGFGRPDGSGQGAVLLRAKDVELSRDDLEWPEPGDARELTARRVNTRQLREEAERERRRALNEGRQQANARRRRTGDDEVPLVSPLLVDCVGRGGSTLAMQLLDCSPEIRVEGPFPYERRYFAYFLHWSQLLEKREWPKEVWNNHELARGLRWNDAIIGPPPWDLEGSLSSTDASMAETMLRAAWHEFSHRIADGAQGAPGFYAEKSVDTARLDLRPMPEARILAVVRDPRDVFVSAELFNAKRGRDDFGRADLTDEKYLDAFIERHQRRFEWILRLDEGQRIRYEDIVADPAEVARRLADELSIEFDLSAVQSVRSSPRPDHVTAASIPESVGRWRSELDPAKEERLSAALGRGLQAFGYAR